MGKDHFFGKSSENKFLVLVFTIVACVILAFYATFVMHKIEVYTHFFYIPIILSGMWYHKKALYVALGLGMVHILVTYISPISLSVDEFGRAIIFILVAYVIGSVSERQVVAEEKLRSVSAHKQLLDIVEFLPDATFVIDQDKKVIAWNQAIEVMTGVHKEDILGKGDYAYATPIHGMERPILVDLIFLNDEEIESRYDYIKRAGDTIFGEVFVPSLYGGTGAYLWITASPLYDSEGNIVGAIESIRDITEHKRVEEELWKSRNELEERVKERTFELETKNAEMERFVYTVSHDLRSPLFTIQGFVGFLMKDIEQDDVETIKTDIKMIEDGITRMDRLLADTLEISRVGRVVNPPEDVAFGDIVRNTLDGISEKLRLSGAEITLAEEWPMVHVDRLRIEEVLVNLIENSIKYMGGQEHPRIDLGYRSDGGEPAFFVRDNGMGIDPDQHEKVFELFYKIDGGSEGTGAGLAIVNRIIEVHGGRMWIESEEGQGCTIYFTLPLSSAR